MIILSDVQVFLEIVQTGHFTGAARRLGAAKSNVTRQLGRLESELGVKLFARTTRSLSLTDEGQVFLPYARRLIDDGQEAASVLQARKGRGSGLLRISSPTTFGRWFLAPHLAGFRKRHPDVRISLELTSKKVELGPEGADIALRLGPLVDPGLSVRRLGAIDFCLVASPHYFRKGRAPKVPEDIRDYAFVALRPPVGERRIELRRGRQTTSVGLLPVAECNDPDVVLTICRDGGGIAALPRFLVAEDLRSGALQIVLAGWAPPAAEILVVYSAQTAPPLRVQAFIEFLFDTLGELKPWAAE
jgi:DNA-binding transcriptional LysR family regulator